jgi:hypothetical protein
MLMKILIPPEKLLDDDEGFCLWQLLALLKYILE